MSTSEKLKQLEAEIAEKQKQVDELKKEKERDEALDLLATASIEKIRSVLAVLKDEEKKIGSVREPKIEDGKIIVPAADGGFSVAQGKWETKNGWLILFDKKFAGRGKDQNSVRVTKFHALFSTQEFSTLPKKEVIQINPKSGLWVLKDEPAADKPVVDEPAANDPQ